MAQLGNPLAFRLGGGDSAQEAAYQALKSAVGIGNSTPGDRDQSILESWRYAKARGLAACMEDRRVAAQGFPFLATDMIPMYEQLLGMSFPLATSDQQKRDELTAEWVRTLDATHPGIESELQELDATITVIIPDRDFTRDTLPGRYFEDWDPTHALASGPAYNLPVGGAGQGATMFPNYSTDFIFLVFFPITLPVTEAHKRVLGQIRDVMNEAMPAWCDQVTFSAGSGIGQPCGFLLDTDPLDLTVFCA